MTLNRIAVIPARGGSKRIPRKNIREFCGKPMIKWSIEAVKASQCFEKIIVSTDDSEIARVARDCGALTPFIRPEELAGDWVGTLPVMRHAVQWLNNNDATVDFACCVYATAPFLTPSDIEQGWQSIRSGDYNYVFSVTSYAFPIQRALRIKDNGRVSMFAPEHFNTRSQDLEAAWHDAGQFYWGRAEAWLEEKVVFTEESLPVVLPRYRVQDIDVPEDWKLAERLFSAMRASRNVEAR